MSVVKACTVAVHNVLKCIWLPILLMIFKPEIYSQNTLSPALGFNIFTEQSVEIKGGDVEGAIAAGGDLLFGNANWQGNFQGGNPFAVVDGKKYAMVIAGKIDWQNSNNQFNFNLNNNPWLLKFGDLNGASYQNNQLFSGSSRLQLNASPGIQTSLSDFSGVGIINFSSAFQKLRLTSSELANNCDVNVTYKLSGGVLTVEQLQPGTNILELSELVLNSVNVINWVNRPDASHLLVINIVASSKFSFRVPPLNLQREHGKYIIWNFKDQSEVEIKGTIQGSILAPQAHVEKVGGVNIEGQIIAKSYRQTTGETHVSAFEGSLHCTSNTPAEVGDYVWLDANGNGQQDAGESPMPGITIELYREDGSFVNRQITGTDGKYLFTDLKPGRYYLYTPDLGKTGGPNQQVLISTLPNVGSDEKDNDFKTSSHRTQSFELTGGQSDLSWDLGIVAQGTVNAFCLCDDEKYKVGEQGRLIDEIIISGAPGKNWKVKSSTGIYELQDLELMSAGTPLEEYSPGKYRIKFRHIADEGYQIILEDEDGNQMEYKNTCTLPEVSITDIDPDYLSNEDPVVLNYLAAAGEVIFEVWDFEGNRYATGIQELEPSSSSYPKNIPLILRATYYPDNENQDCPRVYDQTFRIFEAILPIELSHLSVKSNSECGAIISWETSSEINSSHFVIEYSADGRDFDPVSVVETFGTAHTYEVQLEELLFSNNYFRLKMVDLDGSYEYSDIHTLTSDCSGSTEDFQIFPNPVGASRTIHIRQQKPLHIIRILDITGREVLNSQAGDGSYALDLFLDDLKAGIYLISSGGRTQRLVISE